MKTNLLIATTALIGAAVLAASPAHAVTDIWDFGVGTAGDLGTNTTTVMSSPSGIPIVATGFGPGAPNLFRKEAGGVETGMGLTNDPTPLEDEITPGSFIQLSLSTLHIPPLTSLTLSFGADSVQAPDTWALFLSNTAGSHGATPDQTGTSNFPSTTTIDTTGFAFLDVSATVGNILLRELDATTVAAVPEPLSLSVLGVGLLGLGAVRWHRRKD